MDVRPSGGSERRREGLPVVPGHPLAGSSDDIGRVGHQGVQVVNGVGAAQLRGVNESHVDVAETRATLGAEEERVFPTMRS